MTEIELQQLRREKWRLDGKAIRTIEKARAFIESVGFCLMFPQRPALLAPTFIGAFVGDDNHLPDWQHAFADPRASEATELMVRLLRERSAYEANLFGENNAFLLSASVFPFFYALVGERNPKVAPRAGSRSAYSALACDALELITRQGPISKQKRAAAFRCRRWIRLWANCGRSCAWHAWTIRRARGRGGICFRGGRRRW